MKYNKWEKGKQEKKKRGGEAEVYYKQTGFS